MLAPLVNRAEDLRRLDQAWRRAAEGIPQLLVVWGRRRVGKTFLLSHFAQGKPAVFFGATQQAEAVELRRLTEVVRRALGDQAAHLTGGGFPTWEAALRFFAAVASERPLLVVLDEVPYLARSTPGFASVVQVVWDHLRPGTRLALVLTGSAVGVMEGILGAPRGARATYGIPDPYLRFWFRVLYTETALIDGGQGDAVLERVAPRWQTHVGLVFEEQARAHARRLVQRGELPGDLVVGRWWSSRGPSVEIDVLGLRGTGTALLGEARWQAAPLGGRELEALRRKAPFAPNPVDEPTLALWGRGGVQPQVRSAGALGFGVEDVVT